MAWNNRPEVGRMKRAARAGFLARLVERAHNGERPEVTLTPKGVTAEDLEKHLKANNCGWTKFSGNKYRIGSLTPRRKAA